VQGSGGEGDAEPGEARDRTADRDRSAGTTVVLAMMRTLVLASVVLTVLLASPAAGADRHPQAGSAEIVTFVKTVELDPVTFGSPWQLAWIPNATETGAIAFTDRSKNQVGLLDPATLRTQNIRLNAITSPGPIVVLDNTRFAIAGAGGVGIFDRAGAGKVTELAIANTRNQALAVGPNQSLFVADALQHDLRIIRPPYGGPADITKFPLPQQCRNPTGLIPGASTITVLCQQTNNFVRIDYTGNFGSSTALPFPNMGAQEARPSPTGVVFSGYGADRLTSWETDFADPYKFLNAPLAGPAVPSVGYYSDPKSLAKLAAAASALGRGKSPLREYYTNALAPSYKSAGVALATFRSGNAKGSYVASGLILKQLQGKNLVGSTNGPGGTIWVADATPGKPALHSLSFGGSPKSGRTKSGYQLSRRLTQVDPDFLTRMTMPFTGPVPTEIRVGVVGASASPWNLSPTFSGNFGVTLTARGTLKTGDTYPVRARSGDTGAYTRAYRFSAIRPGTKSVTFTYRGRNEIPASFKVDAVAAVKPCECESLDLILRSNSKPPTFQNSVGVKFDWVLECSGGAGACEGSFSITTDAAGRAAGVQLNMATSLGAPRAARANDDSLKLTCKGDCTGPTTPGEISELVLSAPKNLGRGIGSVTVVVERTCKRVLAPKIFRIAFGAGGVVSARRSDLNGNGVADGKEKR
jgi:hypothetical protein